jgi:hypothetical protein
MALLNTDLFVIQRPSDGNKHFKLTGEKLKEYIAASDTIVYKGSRDFTQSSQDPTTDGTGVNVGDIYINSHPNADATGGWAANITGEIVQPGDRAIWDGTHWDLITSSGDAGVVDLTGIEPIVIDDATAGEPIISVNAAVETSAALPAGRTSRSGVVPSIAINSDVVANAGTASPNPEAVVPADLLKATNESLADLEEEIEDIKKGGTLSALKGIDPIEVTTSAPDANGDTETSVSIKDGTTVQKGAVQLQEIGSAKATSITVAATPGYVDAYYLVKNFDSFAEA